MKKNFRPIFILLFLLLTINSFSQTSQMVQDSTFWSISITERWSTNSFIERGYSYMINGDTTFNGQDYKKFYIGRTWTQFSKTSNTNINYELKGLLRQDSSKVYFVNLGVYDCMDWTFNDSFPMYQENILYDFNLSIGDTFRSVPGGTGFPTTVASIDSIKLENNTWRKIYQNASKTLVWIDNIGHDRGLFSTYERGLDCGITMYCFKQNGEYLIKGAVCDSLPSGYKEIENHFPSIYPNPAKDHIFFDIPNKLNSSSLSAIVTDLTGRKLFEIKIADAYVDISRLSPGIYLFHLTEENKIISSTKIYKQ